MNDRSFLIRIGTVMMLVGTALSVWWTGQGSEISPYLSVTFLDVGQGDSILIETPDGIQALIDGGPDGAVLRELAREMPWGDRTIDLVVSTHPDKDHIGGLVDVLSRYVVAHILTTENRGETLVASAYHDALTKESSVVSYARAGQVFNLGASTTLTVYAPAQNPAQLESNASSIVVKVTYGDIDFMLTGDAPVGVEDYLSATYGAALQSEVLKLGHHGSRTSTGDLFLKTVAPQFAVVSAGSDNSYGHPHDEVANRVQLAGVTLRTTATSGAVRFVSDGVQVWEE